MRHVSPRLGTKTREFGKRIGSGYGKKHPARQAEEALRRSNQELERFAYTVAHELNEPLRTLTTHAQLFERQIGNLEENAAESLRFMMAGTQRMRSFIDDLLRYSHATHGRGDVRPFDMKAVLAQVLLGLDAVIQSKGVHVTHDLIPCHPSSSMRASSTCCKI